MLFFELMFPNWNAGGDRDMELMWGSRLSEAAAACGFNARNWRAVVTGQWGDTLSLVFEGECRHGMGVHNAPITELVALEFVIDNVYTIRHGTDSEGTRESTDWVMLMGPAEKMPADLPQDSWVVMQLNRITGEARLALFPCPTLRNREVTAKQH